MTFRSQNWRSDDNGRLTATATTCFTQVKAHSLQGRADGIKDDYHGSKNSWKEISFGAD